MSVEFTATGPVQDRYETADQQSIQGTESTKWKSWTTSRDNSDIPVKDSSGDVVGYVDMEQATQMKALQEKGYTITGPDGQEVEVGAIHEDKVDKGDVSAHFDSEFSEWINITASDNVKPDDVINKVKEYFPNVDTLDEAIQIILRNSSYEGAVASDASKGVGEHATGATVNFYKNGQHSTLTNRIQHARMSNGGMTVYQQDRNTGRMNIYGGE